VTGDPPGVRHIVEREAADHPAGRQMAFVGFQRVSQAIIVSAVKRPVDKTDYRPPLERDRAPREPPPPFGARIRSSAAI